MYLCGYPLLSPIFRFQDKAVVEFPDALMLPHKHYHLSRYNTQKFILITQGSKFNEAFRNYLWENVNVLVKMASAAVYRQYRHLQLQWVGPIDLYL